MNVDYGNVDTLLIKSAVDRTEAAPADSGASLVGIALIALCALFVILSDRNRKP